MKKRLLIFTIGNRDLQFDRKITEYFPESYFEPNNDDPTKFFISKTNKDKTFYEISQEFYKKIDNIPPERIAYPMIAQTLEACEVKPDKIILIASEQKDPDKQDTVFAGKILAGLLKQKGYETEVVPLNVSPVSTQDLLPFFQNLLMKHKDYSVEISNSGGTPAMRTASILASVSVGNVKDIMQVNAREGKVNKENAQTFIRQIYKHTLDNMLSVYDYSGILNLPLKQTVKEIAQEALDEYNLTKDYFPQKKNQPKAPYDQRALKAISLLVENMRVTYVQGRYAEALQRIFRIEEAVWYLLFYLYLKDKGLVDENNPNKIKYSVNGEIKRKPFEQLINFGGSSFGEFLKITFPDRIVEKKQVDKNGKEKKYYTFLFEGKEIPIAGKNFYYYLFRSLKAYPEIINFFAELNKDEEGQFYTNKSKLNSLRNNSFLGHGLKGVTKEELLNITGKNDFNQFIEEFNGVLTKFVPDYRFERIFDLYNDRIKEKFED